MESCNVLRKVFIHQRTCKEAPPFSGNDGVQRDRGQVTWWLIACKIHLHLNRVFQSRFGPPPKPGAAQKAPEVPVSETPVIQGTGLQVIKSLWHFDFYLGFSLQRVGTWSCSIQADSQVHASVWGEQISRRCVAPLPCTTSTGVPGIMCKRAALSTH